MDKIIINVNDFQVLAVQLCAYRPGITASAVDEVP
jgi:hypothetical protein